MNSDLNIVVIYIGDSVPSYVVKSVNLLSAIFPYQVHLYVTDIRYLPGEVSLRNQVIVHEIDSKFSSLILDSNHDSKFRSGFWINSFQRLLLLSEIHDSLGSKIPILHIEADMLLLRSFPFSKLLGRKLRWFRNDEKGDVASLVYSPNLTETTWLVSQLYDQAKDDKLVTDMSALKRVRDKYPKRIETFPDILDCYDEDPPAQILDGSAVGVWLLGTDSRNTYGLTILHLNRDHPMIDVILKSHFYLNGEGEIVLESRGVESRVHSLHVHTKNEDMFNLGMGEVLSRYIQLASHTQPIVMSFDWRVLKGLIMENYEAGSLLVFLSGAIRFMFKSVSERPILFWCLKSALIKGRV